MSGSIVAARPWSDPSLTCLTSIERTREGTEFVIQRALGRLTDGTIVQVQLPFERLPQATGHCIRTVLSHARRDRVFLGPLRFWEIFPPR